MSTKDDMWQLMRKQREFTRSDLRGIGIADGSIRVFIHALERGGFVTLAVQSQYADHVWRVVRDTPVTPIVHQASHTAIHAGEYVQRGVHGRLWQSCRVLRQFDVTQLAATAECSATSARRYLRLLMGAGYIRCTQAPKPGQRGAHGHYLLVRNPGPYPLRYDSTRCIAVDLNTGEEFNA